MIIFWVAKMIEMRKVLPVPPGAFRKYNSPLFLLFASMAIIISGREIIIIIINLKKKEKQRTDRRTKINIYIYIDIDCYFLVI